MDEQADVRALLEEALNSERTPEEVCADRPDLLDAVRSRWLRVRQLADDLERVFPTRHAPPPRSRPDRDPAGRSPLPRIPGYELDGVIGYGGMGVVYKARHLKLNRDVAIKMLRAGDYASSRELTGLVREAQSVAALHHPNIVQVHDVGELGESGGDGWSGLPYFTMELVEGGSLSRKLDGKPLPAREAAALTATLADAVQAAHAAGIVHRDLKPGNVLLTANGTHKVTDFGLARRAQDDQGRTLSGARVGTPSYMAPEQALGTADAFSPAVDIYALGAILYECLTGRPPFQSDSPTETQRQVIEEEPAPPSRLNARVPRDLETVCLKCLHKDPRRRYSSAAALAEDLRRFLDGRPVTARRVGTLGRAARWARRRPSQAALAAGCVLVAVGLAVLASRAAWRRAETRGAVQDDLRQAAEREHVQDWVGARTLLERAKGRLGASASDDLRASIERLDHDLALAARLENVRLDRARFGAKPHSLANAEASREYAAALHEAGLVDTSAPPGESIAAINKSEIREAIVSSLDDWLWCAGDLRPWVAQVLAGLDPDPWRNQVRETAATSEKTKLESLASTASLSDQPARLLIALGQNLQDAGGDGIRLLRKVQQRHPADFWTNFILAMMLANHDGTEEAIGFYRAAVALRPDAAPAHYLLGHALMSTQKWDDAIREFERALELTSTNGDIHVQLGVCLQAKLKWNESIPHFREALRLDPNDAIAHDDLGRSLGTLGRLQDAVVEYREALRLEPSEGHVHNNLATTLAALGDKDAAIAEYMEAIRLGPKDVLAHRQVGMLLRGRGKLREALPHFQQVVVLQPKNADAKNDLRGVQIRLGEIEQVRTAWQRELDADPLEHPQWDGYAELCLFLEREQDYRRACRLLLDRFGTTTQSHVAERTARACLLLPASDEQLTKAVALVDQTLSIDKSQYEDWAHPFFMFAKGLADYRQDKFEDAIAVMQGEAANVLGPAPGLVRAMALHRLGRKAEARRELADAIARFNWSPPEADIRDAWVFHILRREAESLILPRLSEFLSGGYEPRDNDERLAMLGACQFKNRVATMARLYADAFAADSALAQDAPRRYNAACAAALAAAGRGAEHLSDGERAQWRRQACRWLLESVSFMHALFKTDPQIAPRIEQVIRHWRADPDLAGLRDDDELSKLTVDEQKQCRSLWEEVDELHRAITPQPAK